MEPEKVIKKYYDENSAAYGVLKDHSWSVAKKALEIAGNVPELEPSKDFIWEAALLHDIGMIETYAPPLGCYGDRNYLEHGYLGREMLEEEGLLRHALVCERHTGVGITREEVNEEHLPLPKRDFVPVSVDEEIVCLADKFFSKSGDLKRERTIEEARRKLSKHGEEKVRKFDEWLRKYKLVDD